MMKKEMENGGSVEGWKNGRMEEWKGEGENQEIII